MTHSAATPDTSVRRVRFLAAARGNCFMAEIGEMFAEGFRQLGIAATVEFDALPEPAPDVLTVLIAPHEYFPLFLARAMPRRQWQRLAATCWTLGTEQPGSRMFETAFRYALHCRGVLDIHRRGVEEFARRGLDAVYSPLGYVPSLEAGPENGERDIDILFLAHASPRRMRFLAEHGKQLAQHRCHLVLAEGERPRLVSTPGFVTGEERNRLLRRSRILLNLHSAQRCYFEWHRALGAMANGCLFVSETSDGAEPLCDGEHLVFDRPERLLERCREYLADEQKRRRTAQSAYEFLKREMPIAAGCRAMLQAEAAAPRRRGVLARALGGVASRARGAWFSLRTVPGSIGPYLRRQPIAHTLFYPARSLFDRLLGRWSLSDTDRRRQEILGRLAQVETNQPRSDFRLASNAAYGSARPEISVIITLYNYARYVEECLESVEQTTCVSDLQPSAFEILIVDDASTDDSAAVAERFVTRLGRPACLVRKTQNTGLVDSRNLGIGLARGAAIFILDADNRVFPRCLESLYRTLRQSGAAAVYGIIRRFNSETDGGLDLTSCYCWDPARLVASPYIDAMALFDRQAVLDVGGYSDDLLHYGWGWEDYDLWLKLAQAGRTAAFCPEIVAEYRVHPRSMVRATSHYKPRLVRYFREKFVELARRHPGGARQFGWAVGKRGT